MGSLPSRHLMSHDIVDSFHPMSHGIVDQTDFWYPLVTGFCSVGRLGWGYKVHLRGTCSRLSCDWEAEAVFQWRGDLAGSNRLRAPAARHNSPIITAPAESGVK